MPNTEYTISKGEIIPASGHDRFWPESATDLYVALEHHGYCKTPGIEVGEEIYVAVYGVDSPKTDFAEKFHYIANYFLADTGEVVLIPRLGDLIAFLSQTVPACVALLQQSERNQRVEREREAEHAEPRVSGRLGNRPKRPGA